MMFRDDCVRADCDEPAHVCLECEMELFDELEDVFWRQYSVLHDLKEAVKNLPPEDRSSEVERLLFRIEGDDWRRAPIVDIEELEKDG